MSFSAFYSEKLNNLLKNTAIDLESEGLSFYSFAENTGKCKDLLT